ncbi:ABC transporter substrate-binding protein [Oceanobacillus piezotolerans]|uniref:ABC transporter substrate-binding protein n=1 Tax=Oceanobacillus piezotolerans TaxID=2448030 RepID=A0A498D301_9BACI|nr:ABC transporter substrate-binding protein [Oceanobacillus piezotolerans]RLL42092.1 ABC transporter substrate-binding protein [Oceanobacillus piezotolerans]
MRKLLILILILTSILAGCTSTKEETQPAEHNRDNLVLAIGGEPEEGFDPTTGWGRYGSPLFQSTLLSYDDELNITLDLATDYQVSEDGLIWTVSVREDVLFSDEEPLDAEDIVFTFETTKNSGSVVDLSKVKEIKAIDAHTVQFELSEPDSTFVHILATTGIVPKHTYDENYNQNPIGSGPYQLVQWDKGQQIIVEKNPHFYGQEPSFQQLTFLFLSEDAAFAAAKAGQVDIVSVPPAFATEEVEGMRLVELDSVDNRGVMFPFVPSGEETGDGLPIGNDVTSDIAIRKGINIGIDREQLVEGILDGFGRPAFSIADSLPWWNENTAFEDGKVEQANELLEQAGWQLNEKGIREKNGIEAAFPLIYPSGDQIRQSLSMAFAEMVQPLGIEVTPEGKSWNEIEQLMYSTPVMMGWGSHNPIELYNVYSSETRGIGYYNSNYYSNEIVDEYMSQALAAKSQEEANSYWKKAQWDESTGFSARGDAPWAWLVNLKHLYFVNENLEIGAQKVQPHGHGWPITDFIQNWHWKE